jgi:DNA-binding response OmpR family regulator
MTQKRRALNMARVLVVDDERHIRDLYSLELSTEGYHVDATGFCPKKLEELKSFAPDVIILDIQLVNQDGLEVLLKLRQDYPDLPVIICSAYDSYRYDRRAFVADAYVVKSYDLSELKSRVQQVLAERMPKTHGPLAEMVEGDGGGFVGRTSEISKRGWEWSGCS